jgi:hypothetical protein
MPHTLSRIIDRVTTRPAFLRRYSSSTNACGVNCSTTGTTAPVAAGAGNDPAGANSLSAAGLAQKSADAPYFRTTRFWF